MKPSQRTRAWYYKVLPMAARSLEWTEEHYRNRLAHHGAKWHNGKYSASTMTNAGLLAMFREMEQAGFKLVKPKKDAKQTDWRAPRIGLIKRHWQRLVDLGEIRSPDPDTALQQWARTITGTDDLNWADSPGLNRCIEAAKGWVARAERKASR